MCSHYRSCALFPLISSKDSLRLWKGKYCASAEGHKSCARFKLASRGVNVPLTLLPNGKLLGE
jgi:hypothetical protein